mgnify:CR=1 FL=1
MGFTLDAFAASINTWPLPLNILLSPKITMESLIVQTFVANGFEVIMRNIKDYFVVRGLVTLKTI